MIKTLKIKKGSLLVVEPINSSSTMSMEILANIAKMFEDRIESSNN